MSGSFSADTRGGLKPGRHSGRKMEPRGREMLCRRLLEMRALWGPGAVRWKVLMDRKVRPRSSGVDVTE